MAEIEILKFTNKLVNYRFKHRSREYFVQVSSINGNNNSGYMYRYYRENSLYPVDEEWSEWRSTTRLGLHPAWRNAMEEVIKELQDQRRIF